MRIRPIRSLLAITTVSLAACGSDSTGPDKLDSESALQSLALGLQQFGTNGTTGNLEVSSTFGVVAPLLDQVSVTIDGSQQTMFAVGMRVTFPAGTCAELFTNVLPPDPGTCTPPELGLAVLLWQSHSPFAPPDRMAFLVGDEGTSNFDFSDFNSPTIGLPATAIYIEGVKNFNVIEEDDIWGSISGTLTSQIAATSQACDMPLPAFAKSGTCSVATFDEQGSIVFEQLSSMAQLSSAGNNAKTKTLGIPQQTLHGLWVAITELKPIPFTAARVLTPMLLGQRLTQLRFQPGTRVRRE